MADVKYESETREAYNIEAAREFHDEFVPSKAKTEVIELAGPCPKCEHQTVQYENIIVIRGIDTVEATAARAALDALERAGALPKRMSHDATVICACGMDHDAPEGKSGCGRFWSLHITWDRE
jgi:hypothetical protein